MSITANLLKIFELVYKATENHAVSWKAGVAENSFYLTLDEFSVQIEKLPVRAKPPARISQKSLPGAYHSTFSQAYSFKTLDSRGEYIDGFDVDEEDGSHFEKFEELFEAARRSVPGTNEKLSELARQLELKLGA